MKCSCKKHWQTISAVIVWYCPLILCIAAKDCSKYLWAINFKAHLELLSGWLEMSLCMWTSLALSGKDQNATGHQTMVRRLSVNVWLNKMCCGLTSIFIFVCIGTCTSSAPRTLLSGHKIQHIMWNELINVGPSTVWFNYPPNYWVMSLNVEASAGTPAW